MQANFLRSTLDLAVQPCDIAGAAFFRFAFGAVSAYWAWDYLTSGRVTRLYVQPQMHFKYPLLDFVEPLPGSGMYWLFLALLVLGLMIAVGFYYRWASGLFAVAFTYFFLLERTNYQNHYYLLCWVSWCMPFLPLNSNFSVDARLGRVRPSEVVPTWTYWTVQFLIGIPYFYGGIAKLTPDWLLGQPMGIFLKTKTGLPLIGDLLTHPLSAYFFSIGGLLFDLLVVPLLLWRRTRLVAFLACLVFHLMNTQLFQIHIFPWFMLLATTIFFSPGWPRWVLGLKSPLEPSQPTTPTGDLQAGGSSNRAFPALSKSVVVVCFAALLFHCLWPLRSRLYGEETSWTERGHLFSWRMMLRAKEVGVGYAIIDPVSGRTANVEHQQFLDPEQAEKFARDPELIRQMAHFIADKFERDMKRRPEVYALVLASLNGRKPQLMIDPNVNLAAQPPSYWTTADWIVPLKEPFRHEPWNVPLSQWKSFVELPEIRVLEKMKKQQANREEATQP